MSSVVALTGNHSVSEAMRQIDPDVVPAYPITPQTELMQKFADYYSDGAVQTELICVESEHSAMSACVGAGAAGARVMTATSANGLALMWEIVYIAASTRLPIVMTVVNRALSAPINIHCDHSDSMGCRDSGWIQLYSENAQEAYDHTIIAVRIAENKDVLLPVMSMLDGFIISHTMERVEILDDGKVKEFIGDYTPRYPLLDVDNPVTYGPLDLQDYYFEHKRQQLEAMENARRVIPEVFAEYGKVSGREFDLFERYRSDDAEVILVCLGSTAGTAKVAIDEMRSAGIKAGLVKLRVFRPFPHAELADALSGAKAVAVFDRSASFGAEGGPVHAEARSALYGRTGIPVYDYIYGLGGRDINVEEIRKAIELALDGKAAEMNYIGVR